MNVLKNPMDINSTNDIFKIHELLFKEVYSWACKPRTINIYKTEPILNGLSVNYSDYKSINNDSTNFKSLAVGLVPPFFLFKKS